MQSSRKPRFMKLGLGVLIMMSVLLTMATSTLAASESSATSLVDQVNQLAQTCQNAGSLSATQLQDAISRCDTLSEAVTHSDHAQKKLLIIRLKKTRNLCSYFLQLQQRE